MNLMFWKKKAGAVEVTKIVHASLDFVTAKQAGAERNQESPAPETPESETAIKPGLVALMKSRLITLTQRFRKTPATDASSEDQDTDSHGSSGSVPEGEQPADVSDTERARSKKRLITAGAIGLLVLLLAGIGMAIWTAFTPSQIQSPPVHDIATATSRTIQPEPVPDQPQSAPAQPAPTLAQSVPAPEKPLTETLGKEPPKQQPHALPDRQAARNIPSSPISGEISVGNEDPKGSAMSLKAAIEAMNADSGDYDKKPAR